MFFEYYLLDNLDDRREEDIDETLYGMYMCCVAENLQPINQRCATHGVQIIGKTSRKIISDRLLIVEDNQEPVNNDSTRRER